MTTYLYGDQASTRRIALQWREAEETGLAIDQAIAGRRLEDGSIAGPRSARTVSLRDNLSAGDTLVVKELGSLGDDYREIVDAVRDLMRRRIILRSMEDNLVFDGTTEIPVAQASRDALIAHVAATADARKAAKRAAQSHRALRVNKPREQWERQAGRLQFRVMGAQLAAFAVAVYLLGFVLPAPHRRDIPDMRLEAPQASRDKSAYEALSKGGERISDESRYQPAPPASEEQARPPSPLGLSPEQARRAYSAVANWRSARMRNPAFSADVGSILPRGAHLAIFPRRLVAQLPALRPYKFVLADQRVAIVDPGTRQIIAMIAAN